MDIFAQTKIAFYIKFCANNWILKLKKLLKSACKIYTNEHIYIQDKN